MKQNVYNVPEGFFEQMQQTAMHNASKIRRRRKTAIIASSGCLAAAVALMLVFPMFMSDTQAASQGNLYADIFESNEELIEFYECDIFLNNL